MEREQKRTRIDSIPLTSRLLKELAARNEHLRTHRRRKKIVDQEPIFGAHPRENQSK